MRKNIIEVTHKSRLIAVIIKAGFKTNGIKFFTPDKFPQQLAYMSRPKGYAINSHIHPPTTRRIRSVQETLFVRSGKIRVDFYDEKKKYIESRIVRQGDVVFMAAGGHGFEFMEDAEMIEVKQGPFRKGAQPIIFAPVMKNKMRLKK